MLTRPPQWALHQKPHARVEKTPRILVHILFTFCHSRSLNTKLYTWTTKLKILETCPPQCQKGAAELASTAFAQNGGANRIFRNVYDAGTEIWSAGTYTASGAVEFSVCCSRSAVTKATGPSFVRSLDTLQPVSELSRFHSKALRKCPSNYRSVFLRTLCESSKIQPLTDSILLHALSSSVSWVDALDLNDPVTHQDGTYCRLRGSKPARCSVKRWNSVPATSSNIRISSYNLVPLHSSTRASIPTEYSSLCRLPTLQRQCTS